MRSLSSFARILFLLTALGLGACSSTGDEKYDETKDWSAERLYNEAKSELQAGGYKKATEYYQKLVARYPYGKYAQQALLEMSYAYYKDNEPVLALAEVDRFLKLYPDNVNADYALYLKGLINFNEDLGVLGRFANQDMSDRDPKSATESFEAFRELVERFPNSKYAPDAYARMKYLVNALAKSEAKVAYYYLRRKAYVAAVTRAQYVLTNYPKTPAVEAALAIMYRSYDAMGLYELRDDTGRLLKLNFPDSKDAMALLDNRKWWQVW